MGLELAIAFILGFSGGMFTSSYQNGEFEDFDTDMCEFPEWQEDEACQND